MKCIYNEKQTVCSFARWLRVAMVIFLFAGMSIGSWAVNYVRVENSVGTIGEAFETWNEAVAYINDQPALSEGETFMIRIFNKQGLEMGELMPNKPCTVTTQASRPSDKYPLSLPDVVNLAAPLVFDKVKLKDIEYGYTEICANGHELKFTENVEMDYGFEVYLYGGFWNSKTPIENTSIILNGGSFATVCGGSRNTESVITGTATIQVGGTIESPYGYLTIWGAGSSNVQNDSGTAVARVLIQENARFECGVNIYGANDWYSSSCDSSAVIISGNASLENGCYVYAGGELGKVRGTLLRVTGSPRIGSAFGTYSLFGGGAGENSEVGNTTVEIEGGTFSRPIRTMSDIFGGGYACTVTGDTHVNISGGTGIYRVYGGNAGHDGLSGDYDGITEPIGGVNGIARISVSGGSIDELYGGGAGSGTKGVGGVDIRITGTDKSSDMEVYGGSVLSQVSGDVNVSIEGGTMESVFLATVNGGTVTKPIPNWCIEGNTNILVKGGTINKLGGISVNAGTQNTLDIKGDANIIVEGNDAKIGSLSAYGLSTSLSDGWRVAYKPTTLIFKDCGTASSPYYLPSDIELFTKVVADNSYINMDDHSFIIKGGYPMVLEGKTWQKPKGNFVLESWEYELKKDEVEVNDVLVRLEETDDWSAQSFSFDTNKKLYQVGNTIRYDDGTQTFHTVTIEELSEENKEKGTLEVVWDGTIVKSGDRLPDVEDLKLTATVAPALGYSAQLLKDGKTQDEMSLETACNEDMTFSATFAEKSYTITYEQPENGSVEVLGVATGDAVAYKTVNKLVIKPNAGYQIAADSPSAVYTQDGTADELPLALTPIEGESGSYSFNMPAGDVTITVALEAINYKVELIQPEGGTISADVQTATVGQSVTLSYQEDSYYVFKHWTVKDAAGNSVEVSPESKFVMPTSDVTVTAAFNYNPPYVPSYYDLHFEPNDSVTLTASKTSVVEGSPFVFTAEAAEGYDPATLVVEYKRGRNGTWKTLEAESNGKFRIRSVYNDIYVRASIQPIGDPTAIDRVEDGANRVCAIGKRICITVATPVEMRVITLGGRIVRTEKLSAGYNELSGLPSGMYIVMLSDGTRCKVIIR